MLIVFIVIMGNFPVEIFAWQGMSTPPLHVDGRWLKDPVGNNVILHGWMQPTSSYFNGRFYHDPTTFTPADCAEALNVYKSVVDLLSNPNPLFGKSHGWYNNFVRIWPPSDGWKNDGTVDEALQDRAWNNMFIPYVEYCKSHGIYVVFVGNCPDGGKDMSAQHQSNMIKYWSRICTKYSAIKNADNVMFELCNEPVVIESVLGNGKWGSDTDAHDKAVQTFFQPVVDAIRNAGANNIVWVPGLIWQQRLQNFAKYPISGKNIGYAGHKYPMGANNALEITLTFNSDMKKCSDKYPIIVTEGSWNTMGTDQGLRTGTTEVFGSTIKKLFDKAGNISWMCGMTEELIGNMSGGISKFTFPDVNCGRAGLDWWPTYTWCAPDDGTPKFLSASVTDSNPKQIQVAMNHSIIDSVNFAGFTVKIDNQIVTIDNVVLKDTNQLAINLNNSILKNNTILLTYSNGNVVSVYNKKLANFTDMTVDNLLRGAAPKIVEVKTNKAGDSIIAKLNMKMQCPLDISALTLKATYNEDMNIPLSKVSFLKNDSTLLAFPLDKKVYGDYKLLLSYSGNNISSSKNGLLEVFSDFPVTNYSIGLPVQIRTAKIETNGLSGVLEFSKPMAMIIKHSAFTLNVNKKSIAFKDLYSINNTIPFTLSGALHYGDTITVSYASGNVTATDLGILETFSNFPISNPIKEPLWLSIPGKIEAEKYCSQSGIQTENTSDTGGGLNVGWIDTGDWMEYAINNNSTDSIYEIAFRVASATGEGKFEYYLDNKKISLVSVPNTGSYQTWQSVVANINISQGKHYLKLVATNSGLNINYCNIKKVATGIESVTDDIIKIYPNPVSKEMIIRSTDFKYNKVEIIDVMGKTVLSRLTAYESELNIQVNLPNGMYIVKISNEKQSQLKRIIIDNN